MLRVSYSPRNTDIPTLIGLGFWYLCWVPMCAVVVYVIYLDPSNYFLWFWMIFGLLGLIMFPVFLMELFTTYTFSEEPDHYQVRTENFLTRRDLQVPKDSFITFEFDPDDDRESDQLSLVYMRDGKSTRHRLMTYLRKPAKRDVVNSLRWLPRQTPTTLTPPTPSP